MNIAYLQCVITLETEIPKVSPGFAELGPAIVRPGAAAHTESVAGRHKRIASISDTALFIILLRLIGTPFSARRGYARVESYAHDRAPQQCCSVFTSTHIFCPKKGVKTALGHYLDIL